MASTTLVYSSVVSGYGRNPALSSNSSCLGLKLQFAPCISKRKKKNLRTHIAVRPVLAAQSNFLKVVQRVWKVGRDGIEAGTNLLPNSVPRPIARISVAVVVGTLALFVFKSILSTLFFALAVMGLVYFTYIALNKDEGGPRKGAGFGGRQQQPQSTDDALEEAKRIMDKYK